MTQEVEIDRRDAVADVMHSVVGERQLLARLRAVLAQQRQAVASDDAAGIELASRAVASAVLTLDTARHRREELMALLSNAAPVRLDTLELYTGPIDGLQFARNTLRSEAEGVIADLALTQAVLQGALRAGDAWLQALFGSVADVGPGYRSRQSNSPGGQLLNRRA